MVQVVGQPLEDGDTIDITGPASPHMSLYVFTALGRHEYRLAVPFKRIGLTGRRLLTVKFVSNGPSLVVWGHRVDTSVTKLR